MCDVTVGISSVMLCACTELCSVQNVPNVKRYCRYVGLSFIGGHYDECHAKLSMSHPPINDQPVCTGRYVLSSHSH